MCTTLWFCTVTVTAVHSARGPLLEMRSTWSTFVLTLNLREYNRIKCDFFVLTLNLREYSRIKCDFFVLTLNLREYNRIKCDFLS